jgi:xylulokinase
VGHLIGVDVGSQSVKAVLCAPDGTTLATASHPCTMLHPRNGWSEQRPGEWQEGIAATVRALLTSAAIDPSEVSHLGLACQVDGVVAVGRDLSALRNAIIWLDRRAARQARDLEAAVGAEPIFRLSGLNTDASHSAPKMMWLREEEPATYRASHLLLPVSGFLIGWLTGVAVQDHANASSSLLYDVQARDWSPVLLNAAGIDSALLAPLVPAHRAVGTLRASVAAQLGLSTRCVAIAGTGDDHAASLAAGVVAPGTIADVTGTAEPVAAACAEPVFDELHLVETHAHAVDGQFLIENPGFVSGGSTMWLAAVLRASQQGVFDSAAKAPPGADGVRFVPALSGATAPRWNDRMRGAFTGLSMNHLDAHLSRAVLEGCAFALRDITDRLAAIELGGGEIRVVGGGCRSELWLQIKADVTGLPVRPVLDREPTALGAAVLAAVSAGQFGSAAEAAGQMTRLSPRWFEPDPATAGVYAQAYLDYRQLFDALEQVAS